MTAALIDEPALTIASMVRSTISNAPFVWGWNRNEDNSLNTVTGLQDYTVALTDFGYLETVSLQDPNGVITEIKDVYNTKALGRNSQPQQRPNAISIKSVNYGTNVTFRFMGTPDQIYNVILTYQKLVVPFTNLASLWSPIPDSFVDIFNNLFLAESFQVVDDSRGALYRQRGVAALLSKAEGLNEMQKNAFAAQYLARDSQALLAQLKTQLGSSARGI